MELIIIDESRIKLMLTAEDMAAYRTAVGEVGTKEALRGILRDAREKCGCRGMRGRIYIEMYPSKTGGCELFVTKLAERESGTSMKSGNDGVLAEYRKYIFRGRVIYSFDAMPHLLDTCLGLMKIGYAGESSAYHDEVKRRYYLILDCESHIAGENLGSLCQSSAYYYINEHCRRICTDAVATLGKLA
ncbi:MAG: hypothetical protein ACI4V1_02170 [Eubacteriales bacterium]